jgi:hypothetical protein
VREEVEVLDVKRRRKKNEEMKNVIVRALDAF